MNELFAICATFEVDEGGARGFALARLDETGATTPWPIVITRKAHNFYGFENACPHQGSRLDTYPGEFLDKADHALTCGKHGAQFALDTGHCFSGPCEGKALTPIALVIDDGDICVAGIELAEEDGMDIEDPNEVPEVMITGD